LRVNELFWLVCKGDTDATELELPLNVTNTSLRMVEMVYYFSFDGYDEIPENHLQKESLITSILKHQVLPYCGLVVSSCPHASVRL